MVEAAGHRVGVVLDDAEPYWAEVKGCALGQPAAQQPVGLFVGGALAGAVAIFLVVTNLKGVSSMKLHRDLGVTQRTAWFMLHRIREAWSQPEGEPFAGPVEADETYVGGEARNMHARKRAGLAGRGAAGKAAVAGVKDRATNQVRAAAVPDTTADTLTAAVAGAVEGMVGKRLRYEDLTSP